MELVREINDNPIKNPMDVNKYLEEFKNEDREHFIVIGLDTKNKPCYREITALGTLNSTLVHPREVFKKAIIMSCNTIIIAHNHPSGDLKPSSEDLEVTKKLKQAGDLLGIKLLDHIIVSNKGFKSIIGEVA